MLWVIYYLRKGLRANPEDLFSGNKGQARGNYLYNKVLAIRYYPLQNSFQQPSVMLDWFQLNPPNSTYSTNLIQNRKNTNTVNSWQYDLTIGRSRISQGGGANSKDGCEKLIFGKFFPKTAWNWKNLDPHGGGGGIIDVLLDPPMFNYLHWIARLKSSKCPRGGGYKIRKAN